MLRLLSLFILLLASPAYGAVAFDIFASNTTNGTGDFSIALTPVGTARGLIVYIVCNASGADEITSVNINGTVSLTEATESPVLNTTGELGSTHCFFVGSGIPAGALTINVVTSGATSTKIGYAVSLTADQDTSVVDTGVVLSNNIANPSVTLSLSGISCFAMLGAWSGIGNASIAPLTNWTERNEFDFGNQDGWVGTYDIVGTTDVTAGYTAGGDDAALHAVAVRENAAGGATGAQVILVS